MQFIVQWTNRPEHRNALIARYKETGGMPPDGVKMIDRWHVVTGGHGFNLVETNDATAIAKWAMEWSDLLTIEYFPVVGDEEIAEVLP